MKPNSVRILVDDKIIDGVRYLNTGDFIENNSYIIYNNNEYTVFKG